MRKRWGYAPAYMSVSDLQRGLTYLGKAVEYLIKDPRTSFSKPKHLRDSMGESWRGEVAGRSVPHLVVSGRSSMRGALTVC
jgi:hypothetical protein